MDLHHTSSDYRRIAPLLGQLRAHARQPGAWQAVAARHGLSEPDLRRLFERWAGTSPERFSHYLTAEYARATMPLRREPVPGRVSDVRVQLEALTPEQFQRQAAGLQLRWGRVSTPFGQACLAFNDRGICHLAFEEDDCGPQGLSDRWPQAELVEAPSGARRLVEQVFAGGGAQSAVSVCVSGTDFQLRVWRALLAIPAGGLLSYRQVAEQLGRPGAARAVGTAIANNPIGYLIPCHRVLPQSGETGRFRWGSDRKAAMIAWEAAQLLRSAVVRAAARQG
jgi:AraC family transcriptional regulator of adaptative response/methylated-DNA-[protein]-cysteine methyltransferase